MPDWWVGPRIRLVTFAVSVFGSFGAQAQTLLAAVARRCGRSVPCSLLDEASWATPSFAPYARATVTLTLRRSLAHSVGEQLIGETEAARLHEAAVARAAAAESDSEFDDAESDVE